MKSNLMALPIVLAMSLAMPVSVSAQTKVTPTMPATQIEPAALSSPYEFVSAATSIDAFTIEASGLAKTRAASTAVKALAADLAAAHAARIEATRAAGKADKVDIAEPAVDGEQKGLISKLEALDGAAFDRAYLDAMVYVHQRAIAYYAGFAKKDGELARFAAASLPVLVTQYDAIVALAGPAAAAEPAPKG